MNQNQCKSLLAAWMIGEGIITLLFPARYYRLWSAGPGWKLDFVKELSKQPNIVRGIGLTELLIGLWLAKNQVESE